MTDNIVEKELDAMNKTLDLVNKVYDDGLSNPVKVLGDGLTMCLSFIGARFSPMMYEYIQNAEYKKKEIDIKLQKKYENILEENRVNPRMNILGPAVDILKYNLDEEHIKEIFINLLSNEMNKDKQDKVLPSYIEIVKQLSSSDANLLKKLYEAYKKNKMNGFTLDIIRRKFKLFPTSYVDAVMIAIVSGERNNDGAIVAENIILEQICVDNLSRLELLKIYDDRQIAGSQLYGYGFKNLKHQYEDNLSELFLKEGCLYITDYGLNFLNICFE